MKIIRFVRGISLGIIVALFMLAIAVVLVVIKLDKEEIVKTQCIVAQEDNKVEELFLQKEILDKEINNSCNHYNVVVTLIEDINEKETTALLVRLALIKKEFNITKDIQVFINHPSINYIASINNGEVIIANK